MAVMIGQCRCHNSNPNNFWRIVNPYGQNEFWGICCKKRDCNSEYLVCGFTNDVAESNVTLDGIPLYYKNPSGYETDPDFQADTNRERITGDNFTSVQRGDHLGFRRSYGIWHHAIVENVEQESLVVIGWGKERSGKIRICRESLSIGGLKEMWKFKYSSAEEEHNPAYLVIARAISRLAQSDSEKVYFRFFVWDDFSEKYGLLNQNCETFATYCKRGFTYIEIGMLFFRRRVAASCQLPWLRSKVKEIAGKLCQRGGRALALVVKAIVPKINAQFSAETVENLLQFLTKNAGYFELIGLGVVVTTQIYSFYKFKWEINRRRQSNGVNDDALNQEIQTKRIECFLTIVLYGVVGTALFFASCPFWLEVIISSLSLIACKLLLPQLLSYFLECFYPSMMSHIYNFLRQPVVAIMTIQNQLQTSRQTRLTLLSPDHHHHHQH